MALATRKLRLEFFAMKIYEDGTVDRSEFNLMQGDAPATPYHATHGALSRDVIVDSTTGVWVRLYIPERALSASPKSEGDDAKLPIIIYFHGGGFVLGSAAHAPLHRYCCKVAAGVGAIMVSVNYRLAPEYRLPVAFDDSLSALQWLESQASKRQQPGLTDPWLSEYADLGSCFLMGHSAGGTLVHQTAVRAATAAGDRPDFALKIRGLICLAPFFGGVDRTRSEIDLDGEDFITLEGSDAFWALALPEGADRGHPYCTFRTLDTQDLLRRKELPPSLVVLGGRDPLHDRGIQYVEFLREGGVDVILREYPYYGHPVMYPDVDREEDVEEAYSSMLQFMRKCLNQRADRGNWIISVLIGWTQQRC